MRIDRNMLILSNDDVRAVLPMAEALSALEQAYRDFANGLAHGTTTRLDTRVTLSDTGRFFSFMSMEGTTPDGDLMALRFNANHEIFVTVNGKSKKAHLPSAPGARYLGLVLLVAMRDTRPLALLHDGYLSALRIGATSALAAHCLSRPDAGDVGLIGCGDQARAQLLGLAEQYPDLSEVVTGRVAGRSAETQITFFMNNAGLGFQFAACGARAYALARERGLGHEVPTDWFLQPMTAWMPRDTDTFLDHE